jgi:hypothetical protein
VTKVLKWFEAEGRGLVGPLAVAVAVMTLMATTGLANIGLTTDRRAEDAGDLLAVGPTDELAPSSNGDTAATEAPSSSGGATGASAGTKVTSATARVGGAAAAPLTGGRPIQLAYLIQDSAGVSAVTGRGVGDSGDIISESKADMEALVAWANANGGVGGRKIVAKETILQSTSQTDERLAACTKITEDDKADVVMDATMMVDESLTSCFAKHKVPIYGFFSFSDRTYFDSVYPYVFTSQASLDRQMRAMVDGLRAAGYFNGEKVGVIIPDTVAAKRDYEQVMKPGLDALHVNYQVRFISNSSADGGAQQQQTASAELAFASSGVTHVIFVHNIIVYLAFTNQARSQNYHPRYAFPDYQGAAGVAAFYGGNDQNANSVAVSANDGGTGVQPDNSRSTTDSTSPIDRSKLNKGAQECFDLLGKLRHKDYYKAPPQTFGIYYCDEFFPWLAAARSVGAGWAGPRTGEGMRAIGANPPPSSITHSTAFNTGHGDGASSVAVGRFDTKCSCFVRATEWLPLPV